MCDRTTHTAIRLTVASGTDLRRSFFSLRERLPADDAEHLLTPADCRLSLSGEAIAVVLLQAAIAFFVRIQRPKAIYTVGQ